MFEPTVDIAVWLHDLIMCGLRSGRFQGHERGPAGAIERCLLDTFGEFMLVAEAHFEGVYGCSPYAFAAQRIGDFEKSHHA